MNLILPDDIKLQELYKHLSYEDLIHLCQTNHLYHHLCQRHDVWQFLLQRDFGIVHIYDNPKHMYHLYNHALDFLSNYFNIITLKGLMAFVEFISPDLWDELNYEDWRIKGQIFTVHLLLCLIQNTIQDVIDDQYVLNHPFIIQDDINLFMDQIENHFKNQINFDEMMTVLNEHGCKKFESLINKPSLAFFNKKLKLIRHDIDLAQILNSNFKYRCSDILIKLLKL
jgi:hypothetical protein